MRKYACELRVGDVWTERPQQRAARAEIKYVPPSASMTPLDVAQPEIRTMAANAHDEATALPTKVFT